MLVAIDHLQRPQATEGGSPEFRFPRFHWNRSSLATGGTIFNNQNVECNSGNSSWFNAATTQFTIVLAAAFGAYLTTPIEDDIFQHHHLLINTQLLSSTVGFFLALAVLVSNYMKSKRPPSNYSDRKTVVALVVAALCFISSMYIGIIINTWRKSDSPSMPWIIVLVVFPVLLLLWFFRDRCMRAWRSFARVYSTPMKTCMLEEIFLDVSFFM